MKKIILFFLGFIMIPLTGCMSFGNPDANCQSQKISFPLPPDTARFTVNSTDPGLMVYVNSAYIGTTPLDTLLPTGVPLVIQYESLGNEMLVVHNLLHVTEAGKWYVDSVWPREQNMPFSGLDLYQKSPLKRDSCSMTHLNAIYPKTLLKVASNPPGAVVSIGGQVIGKTPLSMILNPYSAPLSLLLQEPGAPMGWSTPVYLTPGNTLAVYHDFNY